MSLEEEITFLKGMPQKGLLRGIKEESPDRTVFFSFCSAKNPPALGQPYPVDTGFTLWRDEKILQEILKETAPESFGYIVRIEIDRSNFSRGDLSHFEYEFQGIKYNVWGATNSFIAHNPLVVNYVG